MATVEVDEMFARIFGSAPSHARVAAGTPRTTEPRSWRCPGCGLEQPAIVPSCLQCDRPQERLP